MSIKSKLVAVAFTLCGFQQAHAQGLDLTPALLGCVMSGGSCLTAAGIPVIDALFGADASVPMYDRRAECFDLRKSWCSGNGGHQGSGYYKCRAARMAFYKQKAKEKGEWPDYINKGGFREEHEYQYFKEREDYLSRKMDGKYFSCTPKQRELYIKARCGDMPGVYPVDMRYVSPETIECDPND